MYNLKIKNRDDQILTDVQWLAVLKTLSGSKWGISLVVGGSNIWYFQCSDIRVDKVEKSKDQFEQYEKNSEAYHRNEEDKKTWTDNEMKKLTEAQKIGLYELALYMYPFFKTGTHGKVGVKKMCEMLLRYARKCPHDRSIKKLYFKPLCGYSEPELFERFWADYMNMNIVLTDYLPEKDISFLSL